ncbi:DUF4347 domain-containing protein [Marinobacterium sp. D7]|uniref:DUF4347 domain-containing protein n=1 Tax=Marinobacterium ramblicola TaxID=2849041 RepID=UPI001C2D79D8|nr:DUF4347 domain-containing protein [Marinobacterium ramblicola]MBV1786435.1 DUF4347 domain-containing protein [Marinobacterium ramblicola]
MKKQTTANPIRFRRKPLITALEPRILLDGAAVATAAELTTDVAYQDDAVHTESADQSVHFEVSAPTGSEPGNRREVAFVDSSVEGYQDLVDGLGDSVEVIQLDGSSSGLEQMVTALQGRSGIDAIHLFSHGDVGELKLGTLTLNTESLEANAELLASLGESLTESGDLMLYGCYVGAESEGQGFIDSVAELTQADVAASEDLTGAESLGGDWELEAQSGSIDAEALAVGAFDGLLAPSISGQTSTSYTEGGAATVATDSISFNGGANYGDGYLQFDVTAGDDIGDQLAVASGGNISVSGSSVYYQGTLIGTIDSTLNGTNGNALRINLINQTIAGTSPVLNGDFSAGMNNWTAYTSQVDLGVTSLAGWLTPSDSLINYDSRTPGLDDNDLSSGYDNPIVQVDAGRLRLEESSMTTTSYGVVHGPAAYSDAFAATAGMVLKFDWQANNISDDYHVVGYLLNTGTGAISIALQSYGTTGSGVASVTVPTDGNYRFVFISGTFDKTGGRAAGASMYIDNIRVEDPFVTDAVVTDLARHITYANSSDDPAAPTKTVTVSTQNSLNQSTSANFNISITTLNDAPSFTGNATLGSVSEDSASPAGSSVGTLFGSRFSDPDNLRSPNDTLAGIVITGDSSDPAQGEWQYSTNGTNWYSVGSVSTSAGLLLSSSSSLRFVPAADYNGTPGSLSVHAVDSSGSISFTSGATRQAYDTTVLGNTGGDSAVSAAAVGLGTSITAVNDAPVMNEPTGATVTDTAAQDTFDLITGSLIGSDIDSGSLTYGIQGGSDDGTYVTLAGTYGTLRVTKATGAYTFSPNSSVINGLNTTETQAFTVTVSDGALSGTQVLEFALEGVNDNPVFEADSGSTQVSVFSYPNLNGSDSSPGTSNENANLASIVQWVINEGGEYTLDTSIQNFTDADFADKLNASGFFFMTDMESGNPGDPLFLPESSKTDIRNWVDAGGVIMMTGTAGSKDTDFLNTIFNWDLTTESGSSWSLNESNAAGTPFEGGPASLSAPSATDSIGSGTVAGFTAIYGTDSNAAVATIRYGAGTVIFMGYDYYSSGISGTGFTDTATQYGADVSDGSTRNDGWVREIIPRALEYSANLSSDTLLTEGDSGLSTSGQLPVSDVDQPDSVTVSVSGVIAEQRDSGGVAMTSSSDQPSAAELLAMLDTGSQPSIDSTSTAGDVSWTFNSDGEAFDYLAAGESLVLTYELTADDGNGGTATRTLTITINGTNDAPSMTADVSTPITETGDASAQDISGTGVVAFGDVDVSDLIDISFASNNDIVWSDGTLDAGLAAALVAGFSVGATDAAAPGSVNWNYSVAGVDLDFLAVGETITFSYTLTAADGNGGTATDTVSFTITGSNDAPTVTAAASSGFTEAVDAGAQNLSDSGQVDFADLDDTDLIDISFASNNDIVWSDGTLDAGLAAALVAGFSVGATDAAAPGSVNWNYSVAGVDLDFLAVGETITFSYTLTAADGNGGTATDTVSFTITGSNDAPTVTAAASSGFTEAVDAGAQNLSDSGQVDFADLDDTDLIDISFASNNDIVWSDGTLDAGLAAALVAGFSVGATDAAAPGSVNWNYSVVGVDLDFLAVGETITFSYTLTAADGNGGTATDDVTITITGTNDGPDITAENVGPFTELADAAAQALSGSGNVDFTDKDLTDDIDISFVSNDDILWARQDSSVVAALPVDLVTTLVNGFSVGAENQPHDGQVNWTYTVAGADLDFLNEGDTITFSYTVTAEDGQGATANTLVSVTIVGTNDAPEMTAREMTDDETIVQQGAVYSVEIASLFSDKDSTLSREDLDFEVTGLPLGLNYDPETGVISGKPTESGNFTITVTATDTEGGSATRSYEMIVTAVVQEDTSANAGDTTPPPAPETDTQPVENELSGLPDGLVSDGGSTNDPSDTTGFMEPSDLGLESGIEESVQETTEPAGEPQGEGDGDDGATEQVILSQPGALVVESKNADGSITVRASVDVNVNESGQVEFSQDQQDAFNVVSIAVASIDNTADGRLVIAIEDTSTNASSQLYSGALSSGEQLPGWIQLDPATGTVTISNPPDGQKEVSIRIQAIGADGQVRVLELKLDLEELLKHTTSGEGEPVDTGEAADTAGFVPLSDQLAAELAMREQYGDRLMAMLRSV